jgi:hypothetical protein
MKRWIAGILAIFNGANGLVMLFAGPFWWEHVPGVMDTGPFNPHLVEDVGAAYLTAGLALGARAFWPRTWPAAVAGAGFLALHALLHLGMIAGGHDQHAMSNVAAVIVPAILALYAASPSKGENQHA